MITTGSVVKNAKRPEGCSGLFAKNRIAQGRVGCSDHRNGAVGGNHYADGEKEQGRKGNGLQHFKAYSMARGRDKLRGI